VPRRPAAKDGHSYDYGVEHIRIGQQVVDLLFDNAEIRPIRALLFLCQFGPKNEDDEMTLTLATAGVRRFYGTPFCKLAQGKSSVAERAISARRLHSARFENG